MLKNIIVTFFGVLAIFFWIISIQEKRQYKIIYLQMFANLFYIIGKSVEKMVKVLVSNATQKSRV